MDRERLNLKRLPNFEKRKIGKKKERQVRFNRRM